MDKWDIAIKILEQTPFPQFEDFLPESVVNRQHEVSGRKMHKVKYNSIYMPCIEDFELKAEYAYCTGCRELRFQRLVLFNDSKGVCYVKDFVSKESQ